MDFEYRFQFINKFTFQFLYYAIIILYRYKKKWLVEGRRVLRSLVDLKLLNLKETIEINLLLENSLFKNSYSIPTHKTV